MRGKRAVERMQAALFELSGQVTAKDNPQLTCFLLAMDLVVSWVKGDLTDDALLAAVDSEAGRRAALNLLAMMDEMVAKEPGP